MNAAELARALGGKRAGCGWIARCPVHNDRKPSFSIHDGIDGELLFHCHAGCDPQNVISTLRSRGLLGHSGYRSFTRPAPQTPVIDQANADELKRKEIALSIWQNSRSATGTLVETYLAARGLRLPIPPSIRFHPRLKHSPSGEFWPAMVSLVTRGTDGEPIAIHRTFLARNGIGKAPVELAKMTLGSCSGGAIRLGALSEKLMIGEGIESCLSVAQATGEPVWSALSASIMQSLALPPSVHEIIILADNDTNGAGQNAARVTAHRWLAEGRRVSIAMPTEPETDFNDVLMGECNPSYTGGCNA